jgi:NTE family protein
MKAHQDLTRIGRKRERPHKSFGLVLAGGGARGLAHVGVLRALNHQGYYPDAIVGVSMGAVVGATYALNEDWYRALVDMDVSGFPTLPSFETPGVRTMLKNLLLTEHAAHDLYFGLGMGQHTVNWGRGVLEALTKGKNLEDGRVPIFTSATDMLTVRRVISSEGNAVDAIYASSALAGILPPLEAGTDVLIDGGYSDVAPVDIIREHGFDVVVAVDPSQHYVARPPKNGLQVLFRSIEITQNAYAASQLTEADLILNPKFPQTVGVMDFEYTRTSIAAGAQAVRQAAPQLRKALGGGGIRSMFGSLVSKIAH